MSTGRRICFTLICGLAFMTAFDARAATVIYTLDNVILDDNTQMTGTFSWTFPTGDFANGFGQFSSLIIPHTSHDQTDLNVTFDLEQSIEITLPGSVHDDGVDITLVLSEPLTPTTSASIDLVASKYEIGGNGFHDGGFLSGAISPISSCPATYALAGSYRSQPEPLQTLRDFRDRVMVRTPQGRRYVDQYYEHASTVTLLLIEHPELRLQARQILERILPTLEAAGNGEPASLTRKDLHALDGLLQAVADKVEPRLGRDLRRLAADLQFGGNLSRIGIQIQRGEQR